MSDGLFERAVHEWLDDGLDRSPQPAIKAVLLAVKTTPQDRASWSPRRLNHMPSYMRLVATIAVMVIVGAGAVWYLGGSPRVGSPAPSSTPVPTAVPSPTITRSLTPTFNPDPGTWTSYTSEIYGTTLRYPSDWSVRAPATHNYGRAGDVFPAEKLPYADTFVRPGEPDTEIGLVVWQMHIDVFFGTEDLKALADRFCLQVVASSCETFTQQALQLDFDNGGNGGCAILVPTAERQYAFLSDGSSCMITEDTSWITVVVVTREDDFPSAVHYGGSVELLKSIVATMNVWRPGDQAGR